MRLQTLLTLLLSAVAIGALAPAAAGQDASRTVENVRPDAPDTQAGRLLEWFLAQVRSPDASAIEPELGETLNDIQAPTAENLAKDLLTVGNRTGGFEMVRVLEVDGLELDVLLRGQESRGWWMATVAARPEPPHKLSKLRLAPLVIKPDSGADDWGTLSWMLSQRRGPLISLLVEEVKGERRVPVAQLASDKRAALAQASRLFPITLLAERVAAGEIDLAQGVTLDPGLRSLGSEELNEIVVGEVYSVEELLRLAFAGDNAATDQLIGFLGRGAVERLASEVQGEDGPNFPFLTTGEFFRLKLLPEDDPAYRRYADAESEEERRAALLELEERPLPSYQEADAMTDVVRVREVEWRASTEELTTLLARLDAAIKADESGRLGEILNEVSELNQKMGVWTFVARVTGGEPGVYAEAFLVERQDGRRYRFAILIENADEEIDFEFFSRLPATVMTLLALEG
jgi:hypothetical protein